jgi:hypothetical protein
MGFCPITLSMEFIDHAARKRYLQLYDPVKKTTYDFEIPYHTYYIPDLKSQSECWKDVFKKLGREWSCPHEQSCPIIRRREKR